MNKIRVLSDLHIDINDKYPLELQDHDTFTVICGDTSGDPMLTIEWVKKNVKKGILISGNHMPYNYRHMTMSELRKELANAFPLDSDVTYLDSDIGQVNKIVDGIMFVGSCMYTDMRLKHETFNPDGDLIRNCRMSDAHMNDYVWGLKSKKPNNEYISANDYSVWFDDTLQQFDKVLTDNENSQQPYDVVLLTHHPLTRHSLGHNGYIVSDPYRIRNYNDMSYVSDREDFLLRHPSIKAYANGHIHDIDSEFRAIDIIRNDGSKITMVNNARGYVAKLHDTYFNENTFIRTSDWTVEQIPLTEDEAKRRKDRINKSLKYLAAFF